MQATSEHMADRALSLQATSEHMADRALSVQATSEHMARVEEGERRARAILGVQLQVQCQQMPWRRHDVGACIWVHLGGMGSMCMGCGMQWIR